MRERVIIPITVIKCPPTSNKHADLQTMLNKLRVYAEKEVSHCQHTEVRGNVLQFQLWKPAPPVLWRCMLPYTDSFKYLGMVCDKQINLITAADAALRLFTAGTFRVKSLFRNMTFLPGYTRTHGFSRHTLFLLVCESDLGYSLLTTRQRNGQSPSRDTTPSWCVMREWNPHSSIGFVQQCGCTVLLTKSNSYTKMKKVLHADMQLSTRSNDRWSARILSARMVWHNCISSNRSCNTVRPLISAVLS